VIEVIEFGEDWESSYLETAIEISQALEKHYPGHPWEVSFQGHALIVRHVELNERLRWMNVKGPCYLLPKGTAMSRREAVRGAVEAGGQWLEIFQLPRGKRDDREPVIPANVKSYFQ
jgi:hypothetical protein